MPTPRAAILLLLLLCASACGGDPTTPGGTARADMADLPATVDMPADAGVDLGAEDMPADMPAALDMPADMPNAEDMADMADPADMGPPEPRCAEVLTTISCDYERLELIVGEGDDERTRDVYWQVPLGQPPAGGWPAVVMFQGAALPASWSWSGTYGAAYGMYEQTSTIAALLDAGFAVITPEARGEGGLYWDTNVDPWDDDWEASPDHAFMVALFDAMRAGTLGALDSDRWYAAGLSSGGYMTSRMAVSYPGVFRALAIQSGSYATCASSFCSVPELPADHPPTLFLHGSWDTIVPQWTMQLYYDDLVELGVPTERVIDAFAAHQWISAAPESVTGWFQQY